MWLMSLWCYGVVNELVKVVGEKVLSHIVVVSG